jgi:hypothetical protein
MERAGIIEGPILLVHRGAIRRGGSGRFDTKQETLTICDS